MPCAYAHKRFADGVLSELPREIRGEIMEYRELYDIGLHGPDILFYHSPVIPDRVTRIGHATHERSGLEVFSEAAQVVKAHPGPMYRAYLYGYLCHFALDCMCHGYVNDFAKKRGVSHNEIEMEFDRYLTVSDGHDPLRFDTAAHIVPSRRNAAVIAAFFPGVGAADVLRSLKTMKICLRALLAPTMPMRRAILGAFRVTGKYRELSGLVMSLEPGPVCRESSRRLLELYKMAVPLAVTLISDFSRVSEGKSEPDRHLALDFLSRK